MLPSSDEELREWRALLDGFRDDGRRYFITDHDNDVFRCDPQTVRELIEEILESRDALSYAGRAFKAQCERSRDPD